MFSIRFNNPLTPDSQLSFTLIVFFHFALCPSSFLLYFNLLFIQWRDQGKSLAPLPWVHCPSFLYTFPSYFHMTRTVVPHQLHFIPVLFTFSAINLRGQHKYFWCLLNALWSIPKFRVEMLIGGNLIHLFSRPFLVLIQQPLLLSKYILTNKLIGSRLRTSMFDLILCFGSILLWMRTRTWPDESDHFPVRSTIIPIPLSIDSALYF
jgi:hypothetical protein